MRAVDLMFQLEIGGSTKILGKIVSSITAVLRKLTRLLAAHIQKREYQLEQKPPTPVEHDIGGEYDKANRQDIPIFMVAAAKPEKLRPCGITNEAGGSVRG
jgi:hypothetical protein